ncbi:hypothetical protein CBS11852_11486 [Aspergillus niger]|nr:hypothetical protein CBS11852_11486 [Aspergillus niger]
MSSDAVVLEAFTTGHGPSKTGTTGTTRIAFVQLSGHRTNWMSAQSGSRRPDYQQISHPGVQDEEDEENGVHEEAQRAFLPQSNAQSRNDWEVD